MSEPCHGFGRIQPATPLPSALGKNDFSLLSNCSRSAFDSKAQHLWRKASVSGSGFFVTPSRPFVSFAAHESFPLSGTLLALTPHPKNRECSTRFLISRFFCFAFWQSARYLQSLCCRNQRRSPCHHRRRSPSRKRH